MHQIKWNKRFKHLYLLRYFTNQLPNISHANPRPLLFLFFIGDFTHVLVHCSKGAFIMLVVSSCQHWTSTGPVVATNGMFTGILRPTVHMPVCASTGPVLGRCCQHWTSTGPVLATNGMFTGILKPTVHQYPFDAFCGRWISICPQLVWFHIFF